ncbi:uncharacterized protein LOC121371506 [Gigantopelta aegis]|uniref:uncharacterized protein LOC121371506 n=1 Tax=Gigantopelta aegis TaxID=1735272 RepID=UPI001B888D64|nr:uncharacterized protein LOC121371506 [Gigantopelta aegis]
MNAGWVKNIRYTAVPVLSEFQTKSFKQYKQWACGFQMLQRANLAYAKELKKVAKELGNTLKEGQLDFRLIDCIGNFCKTLDTVADIVSSCWQDYSSPTQPYHEYVSITDAKEKDIEKKRQKCTKIHKDMEQKLDIERKKYEKSFREYHTTLQRMSQTKDEEMDTVVISTLNQAHSRMDVASTKYQSTNIKETQKREDFKEEMQQLRQEWLTNEYMKLTRLIKVFEDAIDRMVKTTHTVSSGSSRMLDDCITEFTDVDVQKIVETSLRQKEKQCVLHEYLGDTSPVTLERSIYWTKPSDDSSKNNGDTKSFDWTVCQTENQDPVVTEMSSRLVSSHSFGDHDMTYVSAPRKSEQHRPGIGRWFEESP